MLKWTEKVVNDHKILHTKIGQVEVFCYSAYRNRSLSFVVFINDLYTHEFTTGFESLEDCKEKAEEWVKGFFMPIVKHTIAEVVGAEVFNGNKLEEKASDVLDAVLETISEYNYIENGEQGTDSSQVIRRGDL